MDKKLAIVGSAEGRENAPWNDTSFDIWVFNEAAQSDWVKRWDACFQMHVPEIYTGHNTKNPLHWKWLQEYHGKPIYMQRADERVPDSVTFPLTEAQALIGGRQYFSGSPAYMLSLALLRGYKEIHIFGVVLSASEYKYQAECYRFWVGFAMGRAKVVLHSGENLFEAPLYGYEGNFSFGRDYFLTRATLLGNEWAAAEKNIKNLKSAIERAIQKKDFQKLPDLVRMYQEAAMLGGEKAGALAEAERYSAFGDRGADRGGFEFAAAKAQQEAEKNKILTYMQLGKVQFIFDFAGGSGAWLNLFTDAIANLGKLAYDTGAHLGMFRENAEYLEKYDATALANGIVKS